MDVLLSLTQKSKGAGVLDDAESRYGAQILQVDHIRGPTNSLTQVLQTWGAPDKGERPISRHAGSSA